MAMGKLPEKSVVGRVLAEAARYEQRTGLTANVVIMGEGIHERALAELDDVLEAIKNAGGKKPT